MRRYWVVVVLTTTTFLSVGAGIGLGQENQENYDGWKGNRRADVVEGELCQMRTDVQGSSSTVARDMRQVVTSGGQVNLVCQGSLGSGSMQPFQTTGFTCFLGPYGTTEDSHIVWTSSGQGTLTCHLLD